MSSKKVNPEVPIVLDKERHLLFDLNAMVAFEDVTGKNLFKRGISAALAKNMSPTDLRTLLWACLIHEDETLTLKQVGGWVHFGNMLAIAAKVSEAFSVALPEGSSEDKRPLAKSPRTG